MTRRRWSMPLCYCIASWLALGIVWCLERALDGGLRALSAPPALASPLPLSGLVRVIDGDTIDVSGVRVRLFGIDAPESGQGCISGGVSYPCGVRATHELRFLIALDPVRCEPEGKDRYDRVIATCRVGSLDLGAAMVSAGQAVAYRKYSLRYESQEAAARAARIGIWSGEFQLPSEWRRERRTR